MNGCPAAGTHRIGTRMVVTLFMSSALSVSAMLVTPRFFPDGQGTPDEIAAIASPFAFLCASVLVWFKPRIGYSLGLFGCVLLLPLLIRLEFSDLSSNSWILLNR